MKTNAGKNRQSILNLGPCCCEVTVLITTPPQLEPEVLNLDSLDQRFTLTDRDRYLRYNKTKGNRFVDFFYSLDDLQCYNFTKKKF